MNTLIEQLKNAGEDYEFYPTTREMVKTIWTHCQTKCGVELGEVLDIGCGTCNFKKWTDEFCAAHKAATNNRYADCPKIRNYFVIEKSRILLERLDPETIVLGTDFTATCLFDKPVDTIFCNPPYSEYETWVKRIVLESTCKHIFLIIPDRWKDNAAIQKALTDANAKAEVIGHANFENAERQARAKVDIIAIDKGRTRTDSAFDRWFDETFGMRDKPEADRWDYDQFKNERERLKTELISGKNAVETICNGYDQAAQELLEHFRAITALDVDILENIGIKKEAVKEALKKKISGLKNLYWHEVFNAMEEITSRLTTDTSTKMLERFKSLTSVDITPENIYSVVIWVLKNANKYYDEQLIDFYENLSSSDNVTPYKSNQRVFTANDWRYKWNRDTPKPDRYVLDYRIVCSDWYFSSSYSWEREKLDEHKLNQKLRDFKTIAYNLGLTSAFKTHVAKEFSQKETVYMLLPSGEWDVLFEYRCYKNNNVHIKFNIEFTKALNVEVARLLGWIHSAEDIKREFPKELADGAEKYFNRHICLTTSNVPLLAAAGDAFTNTTGAADAEMPEQAENDEDDNTLFSHLDD